jgi:hypothetical protein
MVGVPARPYGTSALPELGPFPVRSWLCLAPSLPGLFPELTDGT